MKTGKILIQAARKVNKWSIFCTEILHDFAGNYRGNNRKNLGLGHAGMPRWILLTGQPGTYPANKKATHGNTFSVERICIHRAIHTIPSATKQGPWTLHSL